AIGRASGYRDDKEKLSKFFSEIFIISLLTTFIVEVGFLAMIFTTSVFTPYRLLLAISSIHLVFSTLSIPWFYSALEEFRYITLRQLTFQILALLLMFVLVRDPQDVTIYMIIFVSSAALPGIVNIIHARKYVNFRLRGIRLGEHWKPIFLLFLFNASASIYINSDRIMLGYMRGETAVGLYATATKFTVVVTELLTVLRTTILPRSAYYLRHHDLVNYRNLVVGSAKIMSLLSIPACIFFVLLSPDLIAVLSGGGFEMAATTQRILAFSILFGPLNGILMQSVFVIQSREKTAALIAGMSAFLNISLNLVLIKTYGQNAAAFTTVLAELLVFMLAMTFGRRSITIREIFDELWKYLLGAAAMILVWQGVDLLMLSPIPRILVFGSLGAMVYLGVQLLCRESTIAGFLRKYKKKT
ncbi:MAG: polysaccharide biosynthesis C-terminal domain-containing protein, partial [Clostridium sp.]|nr:polysaccharide biosynthesis C-terminal domain-containing protein [Clostridium sp.]